jgi:hypothetical protein
VLFYARFFKRTAKIGFLFDSANFKVTS